ncbi:uncharacterized protein [Ptychodera flava]
MQVFSTKWYLSDDNMSWFKWIVHILQLGPLFRYVSVMKTGVEAKKSKDVVDFERLYYKLNDVCMLRLFEAFMESAPQLVLQLYILLTVNEDHIWTGVSAAVSLISLSWSLAAYSKAHRQVREDKNTVSWAGLILQTLWRTCMILSRVVAVVFFASFFKVYTFVVLGVHWLVMTIWIYSQKTDFCESRCMERLFNCVMGIVYCFCFFNLKEGMSRYRLLAFYTVMLLENSGLIVAWYIMRPDGVAMQWYEYAAFVAVWGGFVFGSLFMGIYYQFFHPAGHINICHPNSKTQRDHKRCNHRNGEDPYILPRHVSIEIFELSELQKTRASPLAYPIPRTPSSEFLDNQQSHAVEIVNVGNGDNPVAPTRAKSVLSHNHSEIASLHSLGLSGFTDDLLGQFDKAQLAFNNDNDSQVASLPFNMSSRSGIVLQTMSARNSPFVSAKQRVNRKVCSASNSPKLDCKSSTKSNKTNNTTVSLEQLPDISLGSPPKSTDAAEVRKIYESILGFYKSKPFSARKLFKSKDSLDGGLSGGGQVKVQGDTNQDGLSFRQNAEVNGNETTSQSNTTLGQIHHSLEESNASKDRNVTTTATRNFPSEKDSRQPSKPESKLCNEQSARSAFELRLERERSKQASAQDKPHSRSMTTTAQIREALQSSKHSTSAEEVVALDNRPNLSCSADQSSMSEINLTKEEEKLKQLIGKSNQENYYHLVSNSLLTLNSTGRSDMSMMNQSKPDKHPEGFKSTNPMSSINEVDNQKDDEPVIRESQKKSDDPSKVDVLNDAVKVTSVRVGKSKPRNTSTPLTVGVSSRLNLQAQNMAEKTGSLSHDPKESQPQAVKGKYTSVRSKQSRQGSQTSDEGRKENLRKSNHPLDKGTGLIAKPLSENSNTIRRSQDGLASTKLSKPGKSEARTVNKKDSKAKKESKPASQIRKERKSLTQLRDNVNVAEKVFIFDKQY